MQQIYLDDNDGQNIWIDFRKENKCGDVMPATISTAGDRRIPSGRDYHKTPRLMQQNIGKTPFHILQYTQRGSVKFIATLPNGKKQTYDVGPEQCFFITDTSKYEFYNPSGCFYSFIYIGFRGPLAEHVFKRILDIGPVHCLARNSEIVEEFHTLFRCALHNELNFCALRKIATGMLLDLEQSICDQPTNKPDEFLRDISSWASENIAEMDVAKLAAHCRMSTKYFQSYFRLRCGVTPGKFLNDLRMNYVTRLLECTTMKLSAIAEAAGFYDASYLCRVFRQQTGITPEAFRSGAVIKKNKSPLEE
jgi:AraC-like DNA-binding protein